jgi:hypothetical protein
MTPQLNLEYFHPEQLKLDLENPRFGLTTAANEQDALEILLRRANLTELFDSISKKGFERFEPLVAFENVAGERIVVEGNRRLAAAKLLLDPERVESHFSKRIPALPEEFRESVENLPVYLVPDRSYADDYIGFKHINGASTWGSLAKAKFSVRFFESLLKTEGADAAIDEMSKRLGDSRNMLLRTLVAYKVFEQARNNGFIDEEILATNALDFSHLYTMLPNPDTRKYLGLGLKALTPLNVVENPIPHAHLDKLRYLCLWLFGYKDRKSVIVSQGQDRPKLQKILSSSDATITLEWTGDFERASDEAGFATDKWLQEVNLLESKAKKVNDAVASLPADMSDEDFANSLSKLNLTRRHAQFAYTSLGQIQQEKKLGLQVDLFSSVNNKVDDAND